MKIITGLDLYCAFLLAILVAIWAGTVRHNWNERQEEWEERTYGRRIK